MEILKTLSRFRYNALDRIFDNSVNNFLFCVVKMSSEASTLVTVSEGVLRGCSKTNLHNESFYSFQGIPYATPPLGKLRFKAPQPPAKWAGIRDAQQEASECYTKSFNVWVGSEDCLYLNVFTRRISGNNLKPVMLWIHGGGFTTGSSKAEIYGPEYLMIEDIVLVTINYRLGPLGFLVIDDPSLGVTGNAGLKDIVMALKWVQRNIQKFGGDPKNVTVFGESAGGAAVHYLMLSPMSKGLFHKAISQSGSALNLWTRSRRHGQYLLAEALGIYSRHSSVILERLQEIPVEQLLKGFEKIGDPFLIGRMRQFTPTVEHPSEGAFLCEEPLTIIKSGKYHHVPFLTGCCSREGMFIYSLCVNSKDKAVMKDQTIIPISLNLREKTPAYEEALSAVKKFYFGDKDPLEQNDNIYRLYTDNFFLLEVYNAAKYHLDTSKSPIYFYQFSMDTDLNLMKGLNQITDPGVCHADDIAYLFKNVFGPELELHTKESIGVHRMVKLWTNFAKYGNPTPDGDDNPLVNIKWKPISKRNFNVLDIGDKLKLLQEHPEKEALEFWNKLHEPTQITAKL